MKKTKFDIQGMTCSSCQAHVEKAVSKLEGVQSASVNLLLNNMQVEYNQDILTDEDIIKAVIDAGYGARLQEASNGKTKEIKENDKIENNITSMKKRLIISICFLIPLMYVAMHHMLYEWIGLPIPQIIKNLFHGTENAITFSFTQFLLLLPIMYVNRNYFIVRFEKII